MRPVSFFQQIGANFEEWVRQCLREIETASYEDVSEVADAFTVNSEFTETRVLDLNAPSTDNIAAVLATFITDMKKRGSKRDG